MTYIQELQRLRGDCVKYAESYQQEAKRGTMEDQRGRHRKAPVIPHRRSKLFILTGCLGVSVILVFVASGPLGMALSILASGLSVAGLVLTT